jgi:shikimate kinase
MVRDYNGGEAIPATITTTADAPAGSGLGSSSALVIALVEAFRAYLGVRLGNTKSLISHLTSSVSTSGCRAVGRINIRPGLAVPILSNFSGATG